MDHLKKIKSSYNNCKIVFTTKHKKADAIKPIFAAILGAKIYENVLDTDQLGTFSGEIERKGTILECVKQKCELGIKDHLSSYYLASEGSFGPNPAMPLIPCGQEVLYFIDRKRNFSLYLTDISNNTNYLNAEIESFAELLNFADRTLFPSHALIIRSYPKNITSEIFKGINNQDQLEEAFKISKNNSPNGKIWVETDMRANLNPTRMDMIKHLAEKLAKRLLCLCPMCNTPGWGKTNIEKGLPCDYCGLPTNLSKAEILGCAKCDYTEKNCNTLDHKTADPSYCNQCNP